MEPREPVRGKPRAGFLLWSSQLARTRPHVKVHLSVIDHAKTSTVWADLSMRGMLVELWRKAGEKYAAKRGDWVPLRPTDRLDIACESDLSRADVAVKSLCSRLGYAVKRYSNRWEVHVRKFSKKQGFESEELHQKLSDDGKELPPPNPNPNPNPIPNTEEEKTPNPQTPPAPPAPRARVRRSAGHVDPRVEQAWPAIRTAFSEHGTSLSESIAIDRSKLIAKRIDAGATADDLVAAVHGYVRANGLERRPDGFDPGRYFRPQTIFKEDGFSDRVDAGRGPRTIQGPSNAERRWGALLR